MLSHLRASLAKSREKDSGFTLVELLVVVVILVVLAAIAVPIFLGQRDKARDATTKTNVANAATLLATAATVGETPTYTSGVLSYNSASAGEQKVILKPAADYVVTNPGGAWCVSGESASGTIFRATSTAPEPTTGAVCP